MAERRMFAKTIIDSDAFLDMPVTARLLYYDLAMRADDDGFVNSPKKIMRMVGASQDDMSILILRKFILPFDNGVVVIKHWRIHNYIRKDRYNETTYTEQKEQLEFDENNAYRYKNLEGGQPMVDQRLTQVRLGKDRLGKDRLGEESIGEYEGDKPPRAPKEPKHKYGEYKHVMLKDSDIEKLNNEIGVDLTQACITHLDEYIEMKGYKAKNHYLAIKKWVIDAVKERQTKRQNQPSSTAQELDDFYNMSSDWVDRMESEESDS